MTKAQKLTYGSFAAGLLIAGLLVYVALSGEEKRKAVVAEKFPGWTQVEGKIASYAVRFPKEPAYDVREIPIEGSDFVLKQELYALNDESGGGYVTSVMVYPFAPKDDPQALLKTALDGMASAVPGSQIISGDMKSAVMGKSYMEFVIQSGNTVARGKLLIEGQALYDIHMVHAADSYDPERYNYFVDSLEIK